MSRVELTELADLENKKQERLARQEEKNSKRIKEELTKEVKKDTLCRVTHIINSLRLFISEQIKVTDSESDYMMGFFAGQKVVTAKLLLDLENELDDLIGFEE